MPHPPMEAEPPKPRPRPKGIPALLPAWAEDHMSAMNSVSDRFSCAIAMALASELEQRMVDDIMQVRIGCAAPRVL